MNRAQLNDHFKHRIRARIHKRILAIPEDALQAAGEDIETLTDAALFQVIVLADTNNLVKAAETTYETKLANPATAWTMEETIVSLAQIYERFETEISILHDLYRMQERDVDCTEIIAHIELRLLED
jgi:hypothetical protein